MSVYNHRINQIMAKSPVCYADRPQSIWRGFSCFGSFSFLRHHMLFCPFSLPKWFGLVEENRLQGPTIYRRIYLQCYKSAFCFHWYSPLLASGTLWKVLTLRGHREPEKADMHRSSTLRFQHAVPYCVFLIPLLCGGGHCTCMRTTSSKDFPKVKGLIKSRVPENSGLLLRNAQRRGQGVF